MDSPSRGAYQNTHFFDYAQQSGQSGYFSAPSIPSSHPPPWNLAGVDYPVGYPTTARLKDPALDRLPRGCAYNATGSSKAGSIVVCDGEANTVLDGWDFSLHNCTVLDVKSRSTGAIKIKNSRFVNGPNCSVLNGALVLVEYPTAADFVFAHNLVDGLAQTYPTSLMAMVAPFVRGNVTIEHNAFLHSPARPVLSNSAGSFFIAYNYWEGFVYKPTDGHGEIVINYLGASAVQPSVVYSFNTVLEPNDVSPMGGTAAIYLTSGKFGTIEKAQADHNTTVINKNSGAVTVAAASVETAWGRYGSVIFDENYMDGTGAFGCFLSSGGPTYETPPIFTKNVNMLNGLRVGQFGACP